MLTRSSRYQCLGNHDIVPGQSGVDFQTKVAPLYDSRWNFVSLCEDYILDSSKTGLEGSTGLPYWTYDLVGADWTATFVVVDSDCFVDSYQEVSSLLLRPIPHVNINIEHICISEPIHHSLSQ